MTREEQIEEFIKFHAHKFSVRYGYETIEELMREMAQWCDNNPKNPWIDINVELPEVKKRVIFLCNNGKAYFGYNNIDNKSATITNAPDGVKVTHWMSIPELPKEE